MPFKDKEKDKEYHRNYARVYVATPKGKRILGEAAQRWRAKHPEKVKASERAYREKNPEKLKAKEQRRKDDPVQHEKQLARARAHMKKQRAENPRKLRSSKLRSLYKIDIDQYEALEIYQNNACAICGRTKRDTLRGKPVNWHVDHDHKTKEVRGLTCANCNRGIGMFADNPELLVKAYNYLMDPPARKVLK